MNEESCILLQRHFRLKQLDRAVNKLQYNKEIVEKHTFEEFSKEIQKKEVLELVNYILTQITRISNYNKENTLSSQEFLSSFVIYGFDEYIIDNEPSIFVRTPDYNKLVKQLSKTTVEIFDSLLTMPITFYKIRFFNNILQTYKKIFDRWRERDIKNTIISLTKTYYELESMKENILEKFAEEELDEALRKELDFCKMYQEEAFEKLDQIGGREYFNNYKPEEILLDESIQMQIKETMQKAYWDNLSDSRISEL